MGVCWFIVDSGGGERKIDSDCDHKEINRFGIHKAGFAEFDVADSHVNFETAQLIFDAIDSKKKSGPLLFVFQNQAEQT